MIHYTEAHKFCSNHGDKLINDRICGCFYCLSIFSPSEIHRWIKHKKPVKTGKFDEWIIDEHLTAFCPYCGIDSVIGESSGYPITKDFLEKMNERWFKQNMFQSAFMNQLRMKGIQFAEGLTEAEIHRIEEIYDIKFPESLRRFYILGVPFSEDEDHFPRWTDFSEANIAKIKERIKAPVEQLLFAVKKDFWLPNWGKRGGSSDEVIKQFTEIAMRAPRLISVYSHRYIPQLGGVDDPPVISAVGRDIIYYGSNLREYLQNEFLNNGHFIVNKNCMYIPFWSDIIVFKSDYCNTDS